MSLEFVIIPFSQHIEKYVDDIQNSIKNIDTCEVSIEIDKDYSKKLTSRISKWQQNDYDIITFYEDYPETKMIEIRFSDKGSKAERMYLTDFIDSISTCDINEDSDEETTSDKNRYALDKESSDDEGGCNIS